MNTINIANLTETVIDKQGRTQTLVPGASFTLAPEFFGETEADRERNARRVTEAFENDWFVAALSRDDSEKPFTRAFHVLTRIESELLGNFNDYNAGEDGAALRAQISDLFETLRDRIVAFKHDL